MKGILGKKVGMTQVFTEDGRLVPVTIIEAGPVKVVQKKEKDKDGYEALQLGYDETRKEKNITKAYAWTFQENIFSCFPVFKRDKDGWF